MLSDSDPFIAVAISPDDSVEVAVDHGSEIEFAGPVEEDARVANFEAPIAVVARLLEFRAAATKEANRDS